MFLRNVQHYVHLDLSEFSPFPLYRVSVMWLGKFKVPKPHRHAHKVRWGEIPFAK